MTFKELAKEICRREGKRRGVNIAQVSEILGCLGDMLVDPKLDRYAIVHALENYRINRYCIVCDKRSDLVMCDKCNDWAVKRMERKKKPNPSSKFPAKKKASKPRRKARGKK